jgi:hypothetical protein
MIATLAAVPCSVTLFDLVSHVEISVAAPSVCNHLMLCQPEGWLLLFGDLVLAVVEKFCRVAVKQLKPSVRVDPHSMRHAGPSIDMYDGLTTLAEVQTRGRWLSADSGRRYAKPAGLLRQLKKLSSAVLAEAAAFRNLPFDVAARLDPSGGLAT